MRRFPLFLVLLLVLSVAADNVPFGDNVSVIESVESPAQTPLPEDALRVMVAGLENSSDAALSVNTSEELVSEPIETEGVVEPFVESAPQALSVGEVQVERSIESPALDVVVSQEVPVSELVIESSNVTVIEEVVEPAQTPYAEDAVAALANGLAEEVAEVPAEEVVAVPEVVPQVEDTVSQPEPVVEERVDELLPVEEVPVVEEMPIVEAEVITPPQEEVAPEINVTPLPPARNTTLVETPQTNLSELSRENATLQFVDAELSVRDANGLALQASVRVTDPSSGELVAESGRGVSSDVAKVPQKLLDVAIELSEGPVREITISDVLLNSSFIRVDDTPESAVTERSFVQLYAIDPEPLSFSEAKVTVVAKGTSLYKCAEWDFDARSCGGSWVLFKSGLTPGQSYMFTMNSSDPAFGEINATAAIHLDASGEFVRDIFSEVVQIDGVWSGSVPAGEKVRVTFERNLTNGNVIDFVARDNGTVSYIDIYVANTSIKVGRSGTAGLAEHQYVELLGVPFPTDTFDLVVVKFIRNLTNADCASDEPDCNANSIEENAMSGFIEFDYIHDAAVTAAGSDGLVAYAEGGVAAPRWRQWNTTNSSFSVEQTSANNASAAAAWLVMRSAPRLDQIIMGDLDVNTNTSAQVYDGVNWTAFQPLAFDSVNTAHRSFDLDYEQLSGRALIVYENSTATDNAVAYRVFDGTTWGSEQTLRTNLSSPVEWIRVVAKVGTNDIMVLLEGTNRNLTAILWNGTGFDNYTQRNITQTGTINSIDEQLFDFVWEGTSGDGLVVWANSSTSYAFRTYNKTSRIWSGPNTFFTLNSGAPNGMRLCSDRTSDYAGFVSQDTTDDGNFRIWNGTAVETTPAPPAEATAMEANGAGAVSVDCAFESQSGRAQFVFINGAASDDNDYRVCSYDKTAWSSATMVGCPLTGVVIGGGNSIEAVELFPHPVTNEIMGTAQNFVENFAVVRWNSTAWTNVSTLDTSLNCLNGLQTCASFAWSSFDPPPNISIVSPSNGTSFIVGSTVNITANASDNLNVTLVNASVQLPSGLFLFFNMTRVTGTNLSGIYELNFTTTLTVGTYNFTVVAFDSSGASRNATGTFIVSVAYTNVVVNKTDSPDPVVKGGTISYQINISNTGTVPATLVNMTEIYPSNVVFNSSQPSPSSGNNTFTIGTLAAGASTLINITVNVSSTVTNGTILNNTAVVNYTNTSGVQGVNASILTTVRGIAIIFANKSDAPDPVIKGTTLRYVILINNTGDEIAYNVTVTEGYPANVVFNGSSTAPSSGNNTFNLGNILAGGFTTLNITVNVSSSAINGSVLNNSFNLTFANVTGNNATATNSTTTTVQGIPVVITTKVDSPDPVIKGTTLRYVITVNNTGDEIAYNVSLVEGYPANVTLNGTSSVPTSGNNTFSLGNILAGGFTTLNITVNVSPSAPNGSILNNTYDVTFANSTGTNATVTNSTTTTVQGIPFLITTKVDAPDPVVRGSTLRYVITINNTDDEVAYNVTVVESYPANVTLNGTSSVPTSGNNTFSLGSIAPGGFTTLNITVNVSSSAVNGSVLNNSYTVTFANLSGTNATISNSTTTIVLGIPVIVTAKSDSPDPVSAGNTLRYVITINNTGDEIAYNVSVFDLYPQNVTFNGSDPIPSLGNNTFNVGDLLPNGSTTINITVNVSSVSAAGAILNNSYNVTFANVTGTNATVTNSTTTTVSASPFIITSKSDAPDPVVRGSTLRYQIVLNNTGATAFNVTVVESYPANVTFNGSQPSPSSGNNTFVIPNISTGSVFLVNITVNVSPSALNGSILNNSYTVTYANESGQNDSTSNSTTTTVLGIPVIVNVKSDTPDPVIKGQQLNYTILINNTGDEVAYNITVTEVYPFNVSFHNSSPAPSSGNNTFVIGNLSPLSSFLINITVNVSRFASNGTILNNSVNATFTNLSGVNSTASDFELTTVLGFPEVFANKLDGPDPVPKGTTLAYQIVVNNTGDEIAYNVSVFDLYPQNVAFNGSQPAPSSGNNTFNIGNVLAGTSFVINITVNVSPTAPNGSILNNSFNATFANSSGVNLTITNSTTTTVLGAPVAVSIKSDSPDPVVKGTQLNYTILVNNTGDDTAFNVTLLEFYPSGVVFHTAQPTPSGNSTFSLGTLAPSQSFIVNITVNVSGALTNGTVLVNQVNLTFQNATGNNATAGDSEATTVLGFPSVITTKADSPDPVPKGTTLTYQIIINNTGDEVAYNVSVFDLYPQNVTFNGSQPAPSSGNDTFSIGNLLNGTSFTINITVNVSPTAPNGSILNNSYNVTFANNSGVNLTLTNSTTTTVQGAPFIVNIKSDSPDPVIKGQQLNYSIFINNTGDDTAFNVTVSEVYPSGVSFITSSPAPSSGNNTFNSGNLSPGQSTTINISVTVGRNVANGTVLVNNVNASFTNVSGSGALVSDSESTTVLGFPELFANKVDSPDPVPKGTTLTYQIIVNNTGDDIAYNITVVDGYPENVTFNGSQPSPSSGNNTFSIGNLLPSSSFIINITVNVSPSAPNASILTNSFNATFANNSGVNLTIANSTTTTVLGTPFIVNIKSDSPDPVIKGQQLNYSILINNTGDDTAFNVTVNEVYPSGVSFVTSTPSPSSGNNSFNLGNLSPGQSTTINISVTVGNNVLNGTVLNNSVNASFTNVSGASAVVSDNELTTVRGFEVIAVTKTDSPDPVVRGTTLSYQIIINNTGDEIAYNITVVDGYPANVTLNSTQPAPTSGNNTFAIGNLTNGSSFIINITVNTSAAIPNATVLNNTVNTTWANLSGSNGTNQTYQETTVVTDTYPPLVFDVRPIADSAFQGLQLIEIAANVTDNVAVDNVTANVTYPNGTVVQVNLTRIIGTDKYNVSFITPDLTGQYNVTFFANDTEGNINNTVTTFFRVVGDVLFPVVVFISPTPANNTYQNITFIPVNITVTEANLSLAWIELNGSRVNFTQPSYNATNESVLTYVLTGDPQSHFVYIGDNVSHANLSAAFTISVGTMDVIVNGNLVGTIGAGDTSPKNFTNIEQFLVIGTNNITYDPSVAVTATVSQSNINYTTLNNSFGNNYTGLSDGVYLFFGAANDSAGNENTTGNRTVTIDTLSPTLVFVSPTETSGSTVARRNVLVNVSVIDANVANVTISLFNSTGGLVNSSVYLTASAFANFTGLPDGVYYFNATAFDLATNNNYSETRNVTVKANPPNVSILSPADASIYYLNDTVNITADVTDYIGVGTVLVQITYPDGTFENFSTNQSGSLYNLTFTNLTLRGNYTVTIIANDTLGNINSTITRSFLRRSLNVIDITNRTGGLLNYTLMVTGNVSGVLNLSANISGKRVKQMNLTVHNESSVYSIFRIDDETTAAEAPNGSFVEYAIDPTGINFTSAAVTVTAVGDFMLYTCKNYNFSDSNCLGTWEENQSISPGMNYTILMTPADPGFLETSSAVDVAMAPLSNTSFVIAFVDNNLSRVSLRIMNTTGAVILNTTTIDATADNTSRVDVAIVNSTHFVVMWVDGPSDNLTQQLFLYNGTNTTSPTVVRASIGLNTDVKLASTADRYVACYANDATNAANFITFFNNGSQEIAELSADADIAPGATLQNLVGCAGVTSTNWTYFWFDDANNDATFSIFNTTGGSQTGQVDIDLNVGETGQVAIAAIGNDTFGLLYYDVTTTTINVAMRYINNTVRAAPIVMDADAGAISRVSAGTVKRNETSTEDLFVISWWDSTSGDIKAAVLNASGANVTAAFTVESQPNTTFRLLDVMGSVPVSNASICPGRFLVAYTNSSGAGVFKGFYANGSSWDGTCDLLAPLVFDVRPINNTIYNTSDIIEIAANVTDDVAVDTVLANITFPNGTVQTLTLTLVPSTNKYNASFAIPITGLYNVSFFANDTSGRQNNTESTSFIAVFVAPQLSATKTDSPDPVPKGTQLSYQITVNNSGNGTAFNITVTEGYPSGVIFHNSSPSPTSGNNTFVIGNVTNGSSFTINITVNVSTSVANGSVLNNSFNLSYNNQSGNNLSVANSTTTTVLGAPFILNIKSDTPDPVVRGSQLNYTIFVNNTGDDTAFNVTVIDTYPSGVVFVSSSPVPSIGNGTFNLGNLSPNQSTTINITVNVSVALANGTVLSNTANASFSNSSGVNSSASDVESTTVIGFPVVFTNKSDSPDPVIKGQPLTYQILINNTGDEVAYNVTVVELYPQNVTFDSSSPSPTSGNGTFVIASIQPNSSTTINITVNVSSTAPNGSILNNSYNLTFANNSGVNLTITNSTTTTVQGAAQITTVKVDSPDPVVKGQQLNYTITVNNTGDDTAFNVTLIDSYPSGVVFVSSSPSPSSGNNTFALGNFSPNQSTTINITVNVSRGLANGTILSNVANVSFQNSSGGNLTSSDAETTTVLGFPEVFTSKSDSSDLVVRGSPLTYQIVVNNTGDEIAYNVTVVESYPENVTFNNSSPSPTSGNGTFVFTLQPNSSTTINITVNVSSTAPNGSILNNSYNLTFANVSGVNTTITNSTTTTVSGREQLVTIKTDSPDPVLRGAQLNYSIIINNTGDEFAYNMTLTEVYPSGVVFVSSSPSPTSGNNSFSLGNFSPNQSTTINITVNVSRGVLNGSVLNNSVLLQFQNASGSNGTSQDNELTTVLGFPEVNTNKTDTPDPVFKGQTLRYQILINNTGDEIAYNVTVVDSYPQNVTLNGTNPAPFSGNNTFLLSSLAANSSFLINITVNVSTSAPNGSILNNSYNLTFANASGVNLSFTNSTTTVVLGAASILVAKSDAPDPVVKGSQLNYTINLTNVGDDTAFNVTLFDGYPSGVVFVSSSPSPTLGNNTFAVGDFSPNESLLINITVNVSRGLANGTLLSNLANVSFQNSSGGNLTSFDTETTTVLGFPEVFTNKSDSPDPVNVNSTLSYQIIINNTGDEFAYNVTVVESYPSNVVFNGSSPGPTLGNNTFVVGTLAPNGSTTINITVNVSFSATNGSTLNNSYTVTFGNSSGVNLTVTNSTATTVRGVTIVTIAKSDSADPITRGSLLNYTINVTNVDGENAYNVTLVESYPANVSFVSASPSPTFGNNTFVIGTLNASSSTLVRIQVNISPFVPNGTVLSNNVNVTFANVSGQNETLTVLETTTVLSDTAPSVVSVFPPNQTNTTNTTLSFSFNASDDVSSAMNCSFNLNGTLSGSNASVQNGSIANFSASSLSQGNRTWAVSCTDASNNTNSTEVRNFTVDFTPPDFLNLLFVPQNNDSLDPGVLMNFTANVTDNFSAVNRSSVVLHVFFANGTSVANITFDVNDTNGGWNGTFIPLSVGNYTAYLTALDSTGNNGTSPAVNFTIDYEASWTRSPTTFGAFSAVGGQNVSLGNLTISNTGDFNLSFVLNSSLNETFFNESNFSLVPGEVRLISVTATAPVTIGAFSHNVTVNAVSSNSSYPANPTQQNTSFTITTVDDAFLFASFFLIPSEVTRGQSGVSIIAQVTNSGSRNASNVTLNITLPPDWVLTGGGLTTFFGTIEPNGTEQLPIIVQIPSNATLGLRDVVTTTDGFNDSGVQLSTLGLTEGTTEDVLVKAAAGFGGSGGGSGGGGSGAGAGAGAGGGGSPGGTPFTRMNKDRPTLVTNAWIEVLRGTKIVFPLEVFNYYENTAMVRVDLDVDSYLKRYVHWSPDFLSGILFGESRSFEIELDAPLYQEKQDIKIPFIITYTLRGVVFEDTPVGRIGRQVDDTLVEYKTVTVHIREASPEQIAEFATDIERLYELVVKSEYPTRRADALKALLAKEVASDNYEEAAYLSSKLKLLLERELDAGAVIGRLDDHIKRAKRDGLMTEESERILALARKAFEREDFDRAIELADSALAITLIEATGAFDPFAFAAEHWFVLLLSAVALGVAGRFGLIAVKAKRISYQLDNLLRERIEVHKLQREAQDKYFLKREIGAIEFNAAMRQYQKRLERIAAQAALLRMRRAESLPFAKALKAAEAERKSTEQALKDAQDAYFVKKMISRRRYELRLEVLKVLIAELDAHVALLKKRVKK